MGRAEACEAVQASERLVGRVVRSHAPAPVINGPVCEFVPGVGRIVHRFALAQRQCVCGCTAIPEPERRMYPRSEGLKLSGKSVGLAWREYLEGGPKPEFY